MSPPLKSLQHASVLWHNSWEQMN